MRLLLSCRVCSSQLVELNELQQLEIDHLDLPRFRIHVSNSIYDDIADRHFSKLADLKPTFIFGIRFGVRLASVQRLRESVNFCNMAAQRDAHYQWFMHFVIVPFAVPEIPNVTALKLPLAGNRR